MGEKLAIAQRLLRPTKFSNLEGMPIVDIIDSPETRRRDINGLEATIVHCAPGSDQCTVALSGFRDAHHTLKLSEDLFIDAQIFSDDRPYIMGLAAFANSADENYVDNQNNNAYYLVDLSQGQASLIAQNDIKKGEEILVSYIDIEYAQQQ